MGIDGGVQRRRSGGRDVIPSGQALVTMVKKRREFAGSCGGVVCGATVGFQANHGPSFKF